MVPPEMSRPSLDAGRLASASWTVEVLEEAGSTNAVVAARAGQPEGLVVVAERQVAGRGRLDRSWVVPERSGLTFSVLLRPGVPARQWPWLPLLTGYAVTSALREAGFAAAVKWPNDVLIDERKVAGILVERVETPTGPAAVVGVGLNVSTTAEELPVPTATSLALESPGGMAPDRTALLLDLLAALGREYRAWPSDPAALHDRYVAACATLGRAVRVELPDGVLEGTATSVDADGRLVVDAGDGPRALSAGDVVHVRATTA